VVDAVPIRHPGQWVLATIVVVACVLLGISVYQNPNFDHKSITDFLFDGSVLDGLWVTIQLTVISTVIAIILGMVLAVFRLSSNRILSAASWLYIWAFRATPLLVQILVWGNFGLLFRYLTVGIPFTDFYWFRLDTNDVITAFVASILALGLHESAFMAEIIRGGIMAVDPGQTEAARSMGMRGRTIMRRIILPQAMRVIIPPTGNQIINLMKASSLVSVIAGGDLLTATNNISAQNYRVLELLFVATFWYFILVSIFSLGQYFMERSLARKQVL
jgi:polar amino acid transport system permease protein